MSCLFDVEFQLGVGHLIVRRLYREIRRRGLIRKRIRLIGTGHGSILVHRHMALVAPNGAGRTPNELAINEAFPALELHLRVGLVVVAALVVVPVGSVVSSGVAGAVVGSEPEVPLLRQIHLFLVLRLSDRTAVLPAVDPVVHPVRRGKDRRRMRGGPRGRER